MARTVGACGPLISADAESREKESRLECPCTRSIPSRSTTNAKGNPASTADHLERANKLIERMRNAAVNDDTVLEAACECFSHLAAVCGGLLAREQEPGEKVKFREFI